VNGPKIGSIYATPAAVVGPAAGWGASTLTGSRAVVEPAG
jgi:hypothetical protein